MMIWGATLFQETTIYIPTRRRCCKVIYDFGLWGYNKKFHGDYTTKKTFILNTFTLSRVNPVIPWNKYNALLPVTSWGAGFRNHPQY